MAERMPNDFRWLTLHGLGELTFCVLVFVASFAAANETDQQFLDGLRDRRLFSLAEAFCRERLADPKLAPLEQARFSAELIRVLTAQALNSNSDQQAKLSGRIHQLATDFSREHPANPGLVLVRLQDALASSALGRAMLAETDAASSPPERLNQTRQHIRDAARQLEQLDKELSTAIPRQANHRGANELSAEELTALRANLRFQLAQTFRDRALAYPANSDDRVLALAQSLEQLEKLQQQLGRNESLAWQVRLERAVVLRLLEKPDDSRAAFAEAEFDQAPAGIRAAASAEQVRLRLAELQPTAALAILDKLEPPQATAAEVALARMETLLALWFAAEKAEKKNDAAHWQKQAVAHLHNVATEHGPYWHRRCEQLLVRSASSNGGADNIEVLTRTADDLYRRGQFDEAVAAYDQAAARSTEAAQQEQQFQLRYRAALVFQKRQQHRAAAERLQRLAMELKALSKASEAHLLAAWNQSQFARSEATATPEYVRLLQEHIQTWPQAATADQARCWLGAWFESRRDWSPAVAAFREVNKPSEQFAVALRGLCRCWPRALSASTSRPPQSKEAANQAADFFDAIKGNGDDELSRLAKLAGGRVRLEHLADSLSQETAEQLLRQFAATSPAELFEILPALAKAFRDGAVESRSIAAHRCVFAVKLLATYRASLSSDEQLAYDTIHAQALAADNRREAAAVVFEKLATAHPTNGVLQENWAEFLSQDNSPTACQQALVQWRKIASKSPPQSARWYRAKYHTALALLQLGEKRQAEQVIAYLQVTPPGLDESPLKPQFLELLERCRK